MHVRRSPPAAQAKAGDGERMGSRTEPPFVHLPQTSRILGLCANITTLIIPIPSPVRLVIKHREQKQSLLEA